MNTTAPLQTGSTFAGRYDIVARLGEGASSVVYVALMRPMMRRVALKVLRLETAAHPGAVDAFLRAGRLQGEVDHLHLVSMVDVGIADGVPFLAREMLDGETLSARIDRDGPIPPPTALALWLPIASAVAMLHDRGVVYGDLEPSSILLARQATGHIVPKLLDLGAASVAGRSTVAPHYLAPELAAGGATCDARSDQWALAVVFWEALAGRRLFAGAHPADVVNAVLRGPIPPLHRLVAAVDPRLEASLGRALQRDPSRRFGSVGAFARSLLPFVDDAVRARWAAVFGEPIAGEALATPSSPSGTRWRRPSSVDATMVARDSGPLRSSLPRRRRPPWRLAGGRPPRRRWVVPMAVATVLLVGVGVVAAMSGGGEASREAGTVAPRDTYSVALRTEPIHARIDLDGEYVSAGVLLREFPRDGRSHTLRVYAPGYEPQMLTFANVGPGELVTLAPLGAR
ncbi:MAG: serine/threonine protein kinase [Deltaproteobacteria bacterium]|nr:serine/threonine protein kinase [Deltaproteobacteria bacterium]